MCLCHNNNSCVSVITTPTIKMHRLLQTAAVAGRLPRSTVMPFAARASSSMTVRDALNSALDEEMAKDETVFVMGEEVAQ
jgi:pyruvate dehydrogenase E1 component beta subunit